MAGSAAMAVVVGTETAEDLKKRRRIQNRVNQRARRERMRQNDEDAPKKKSSQKSFSVKRWRLDEEWEDKDIPQDTLRCLKEASAAAAADNTALVVRGATPELAPWKCGDEWDPRFPNRLGEQCAVRARLVYEYKCSLAMRRSTGYGLMDIIHYNVFSSLITNKYLLETAAVILAPDPGHVGGGIDETAWVPFVGEPYPGRAAIFPMDDTAAARDLPSVLRPTPLQMATVHATWINLVPFPRMRDNLIIYEEMFDHEDFVHHVVGDYIDASFFAHPGRIPSTRQQETSPWTKAWTTKAAEAQPSRKRKEDRAVNGMILWGEAHDVANWEVTAEFVQKWNWALKGCEDLIISTNHWRWKRGEPPLALP